MRNENIIRACEVTKAGEAGGGTRERSDIICALASARINRCVEESQNRNSRALQKPHFNCMSESWKDENTLSMSCRVPLSSGLTNTWKPVRPTVAIRNESFPLETFSTAVHSRVRCGTGRG